MKICNPIILILCIIGFIGLSFVNVWAWRDLQTKQIELTRVIASQCTNPVSVLSEVPSLKGMIK